jgi:hypothetical protein
MELNLHQKRVRFLPKLLLQKLLLLKPQLKKLQLKKLQLKKHLPHNGRFRFIF